MDAAPTRRIAVAVFVGLLVIALAASASAVGKKKHKRLRLTCDQTTQAIFQTAEQLRAQLNSQGYTIEDAPYGLLVGGGCKNIAPLTRQGRAFLADVHYADDGSPPFPGETNPDVREYHWFWDEIVARTKKGKIRTTVQNFTCVKDIYDPNPPYEISEVPC
jgi:hypothetical protein